MASDIIVHLKTHATVTIECNNNIAKELSQFFSSYALNYKFAPSYRNGGWDGRIRFFQMSTNELPIGLVDKLHDFARKGNYTIECLYKRHNNISREELQKFIDTLNIPFELRDYQFEAAYQCIRDKHLNVQASTSSGKSLIIYIVIRFMVYMKLKSIIIVPSIMLVEQMYNDFISYGWDAERYCHKIYGGQKKYFDVPCVIACWQSLINGVSINTKTSFFIYSNDETNNTKKRQLCKVTLDNGDELIVDKSHYVKTTDGIIMMNKLKIGDDLILHK